MKQMREMANIKSNKYTATRIYAAVEYKLSDLPILFGYACLSLIMFRQLDRF